jgi:hypothetical protein
MEDLGEPVYRLPVPPAKSVIKAVPADRVEHADLGEPLTPEQAKAYREQHGISEPNRPLVPTAAELAKLPRTARAALAQRCAARVAPLTPDGSPELDPEAAARRILAAATFDTPLARQLRCVRRDFDRLVYLSKKHNWTDETPVPPTVFGPMWPAGLTPDWARQPPAPEAGNEPAPPAT